MERLRPEKRPRQRVQKVWRSVSWADTFSDECLTMDILDITPDFALRKIALLFENRKYEECAALVRRLSCLTVTSIMTEVPVDVLHESVPQSLCILEALYVKVYQNSSDNFPMEQLYTDQLVKKMVSLFAKQCTNNKEKNCNMFLPFCRTILRIILSVEPQFQHQIFQRKKAIDHCMHRLGKHGMVDSSGGKLMSLHDALKVEFEKVVIQYKCALQKLDELSLSAKHPTSSSVTSGKAPIGASHYRLMQVTRSDVQNRVIKNKTLFNVVEPAITNQHLKHLIDTLQKRIEYDKKILFHESELRKMSGGANEDAYLSVKLRQFSQGYGTMLQLLREITGNHIGEEMANGAAISSDEAEDETSTLMLLDRTKKAVSLNSVISVQGYAGGDTGSSQTLSRRDSGGQVGSSSQPGLAEAPNFSDHPASLLSSSTLPQANGTTNGHRLVNRPTYYRTPSTSSSTSCISMMSISTATSALEHEVEKLRKELQEAKDQVERMQERERQLKERLSDHAYNQFTVSNGHFENVNLGPKRPTELIHQYGNLYTEGRIEALDALDSLDELGDLDVLKIKILFSVIVLSFRSAQQSLQELRGKLRHLLNMPVPGAAQETSDPVSQEMEKHIEHYICKAMDRFDLSTNIKEVCTQIYATLFDYPCLKNCQGLVDYIGECVHLAWGLSVQRIPYVIVYDSRTFQAEYHIRFHKSNADTDDIQCFLWPMLTEGVNGPCVHKGVVIT